MVFISGIFVLLPLVGAFKICNRTLDSMTVPKGQDCSAAVWAHDGNSCLNLAVVSDTLFFNETAKAFTKSLKDCFATNDTFATCRYTEEKLPKCATAALKSLSPRYCSVSKPSTQCSMNSFLTKMNYVIDSSGEKHWVHHSHIVTLLTSDERHIARLVDNSCTKLSKKHSFCSNPAIVANFLKGTYCAISDMRLACSAVVPLERASYYALQYADCKIPIKCYGTELVQAFDFKDDITSVNLDSNKITLECNGDNIAVEVRSDLVNEVKACSSMICTVPIKLTGEVHIARRLDDIVDGASYEVYFLMNNKIISTKKLFCKKIPLCQAITCIQCWEWWLNPQCWPTALWVLIGVIVYLSILALSSIYFILKPIICLLRPMLRCFFIVTKAACRFSQRHAGKHYSRIQSTLKDLDSDTEESDSPVITVERPIAAAKKVNKPSDFELPYKNFHKGAPAVIKKSNRGNPAMMFVILYIFFMVFDLASADREFQMDDPRKNKEILDCITTMPIMTKLDSCKTNSIGKKSCTSKIKANLDLAPNPQKTCFSFTNKEGMITGIMMFRILTVSLSCNEKTLYYSRDHIWEGVSERRCRNAGWCVGDYCEKVTQSTIPVFMKNNESASMGLTMCEAAAGGIGNGCGLATDGCFLYRWYGVPRTGFLYRFYECPSWSPIISIEVSLIDDSGVDKYYVDFRDGVTSEWMSMTFSPKLSMMTALPILGKQFMHRYHSNFSDNLLSNHYLVEAQSAGQQVAGRLGQVQCRTEIDALTNQGCEFSKDICSCKNSGSAANCYCKDINPSKFAIPENTIPLYSGNFRLYYEDGIKAEYPALIRASLSIEGDFDVIIRDSDQSDECSFKPLEINGCYSCLEGAKMKYSCGSDRTFFSIANCGHINISILCTPGDIWQQARFLTSKPFSKLTCIANCDPHKTQKKVDAKLEFHGFTQYSNDSRLSIDFKSAGSPFGDFSFFDLFNFNFLHMMWIALGLVMSALLIYVVLKMIPRPRLRTRSD